MAMRKKDVRVRAKALTLAAEDKVRLAIECSREQRKYIKMYASYEDKTINEFVMDCVIELINPCKHSHVPNAETAAALDASERGEGIISFDSIDDFFKSMES
jgi:hypothetical protein